MALVYETMRALSRHQTLKTTNQEKGNSMARKNPNLKRQTFSITAPGAMSVMLVGDFTHWQEGAIPMQKKAGGVWMASVELAPGKHHYRFIVDGLWRDDPECTLRTPNPYGSQDSVRQVV
jgi:1,4-alpha-glucan branching enzyme